MSESDWKDDDQIVDDGWVDDKPTKTQSRPIEAGLEGLGQGATLGYGNELAAALEQVTFPIASALTGYDVEADPYIQARDKYAKRTKALEAENPGAYMGGQIAGGLASAVATSPLTVAKGATAGARALNAAKIGAATGALADTEGTEGEIDLDLIQRLKNGVLGAGLGAAGQGVAEVLPKIPQYVGEKAKDFSKRFAARALGAERGTIKSIGADRVKDVGEYALENNLFSPLSSTDDMIARNNAVMQKGGDKMGEVYKAVDDAGLSTFNPLDEAVNVENKIGDFYRSPINRGETNQLENTLESILMRGDKPIPLTEAQKLKQELGKVANWKNNLNVTDKEKMARDAYGVISEAIDKSVQSGAETIGDQALLNKLQEGKRLFGLGSDAEKLLINRQASEQGNNIIGLTDAITGAGALGYGGMTDDWKGAGALMLAKKGLGKYGAQNSALLLNKVSKMLMQSPQMAKVYQTNPAAFQTMVSRFAQKLESRAASLPKAAEGNQNDVSQNNEVQQNQMVERIKQNPAILNTIRDPRLKEVLKNKVRESSIKDKVPDEIAKSDFVNNN